MATAKNIFIENWGLESWERMRWVIHKMQRVKYEYFSLKWSCSTKYLMITWERKYRQYWQWTLSSLTSARVESSEGRQCDSRYFSRDFVLNRPMQQIVQLTEDLRPENSFNNPTQLNKTVSCLVNINLAEFWWLTFQNMRETFQSVDGSFDNVGQCSSLCVKDCDSFLWRQFCPTKYIQQINHRNK